MSSGDDRDYNGIKINDYNAVKISLANPKTIRENSKGEVKKPETVNYRTFRPERDGLFCERIFGPERDWECSCGKYRGMKYKGMTCDRCGVKITRCNVRRSRMGHIELAAPVVHIWFFKAASSKLANLLDMKTSDLEKVIYFQDYVVIDPGEAPVKTGDVINESKYREFREEFRDSGFKAEMGAEAVRKLLNRLNLVEESRKLREEIKTVRSKQARKDYITRLRLIDALKNCRNENNPAWMVLDVIPVIPPDLRPLVLLETQTFATSDLNDLYRRIINRNNRLKKLVDMNAPEVIVRNEKRMLQQAVDALFDNARCKRATQGANNRPLKSLTDMIKGKQGRFRENLLGKRVDYSARSVIVVGPTMRLYQCGLPKKIALELFQPFIIRCLKERGHADTIKSAKKMLERKDEEVWDILEEVIKNHPVLLNRAPTLHRMGIQAFEPMLVEGNAIKLHPLACKGFNADFDGDQMAVHLPLSLEAQVEAHTLMLSTNNIFSPANGKPIISPSQDIVMGCYYMTLMLPNMKGEGMTFASKEELLLAYAHKKVALQARIKVRMEKNRWQKDDDSTTRETTSVPPGKLFETTVGRVLFNEIIPCDGVREMPFYNKMMRSKELQKVISDCHEICGRRETVDLLDRMMRLGFEESTHSGLSFATSDLIIPKEKKEIVDKGEQEVQNLKDYADEGSISELERYNKTIDIWTRVNAEVTDKMMDDLKNDTHENHPEDRPEGYVNPIYLMSDSGARGGREQIRQLSGMRGLMAKPNGDIIETPVKANFSEGLNVLEYFSSTHGARKGLSDTALKTADSGYLTRKLVDVAQNCVVTMHDCGTKKYVLKGAVYKDDKIEVPLSEAILGRVAYENITSLITDEVIVHKNEVITAEIARKIEDTLGENASIKVRSPMTCEAELGVCALCYGMDLSTSKLVEEGLAVGTIAAQSIGEPGTQLTMRTFHQGGTAGHSAKDIELRTKHKGYVKFKDMKHAWVSARNKRDNSENIPDIKSLREDYQVIMGVFKSHRKENFSVKVDAGLKKVLERDFGKEKSAIFFETLDARLIESCETARRFDQKFIEDSAQRLIEKNKSLKKGDAIDAVRFWVSRYTEYLKACFVEYTKAQVYLEKTKVNWFKRILTLGFKKSETFANVAIEVYKAGAFVKFKEQNEQDDFAKTKISASKVSEPEDVCFSPEDTQLTEKQREEFRELFKEADDENWIRSWIEYVLKKWGGMEVCISCKPEGGIAICKDKKLRWEIEVYNIPEGAILTVPVMDNGGKLAKDEEGNIVLKNLIEGDFVNEGDILCEIDPHNKVILAKHKGRVHFINIVDGDTVQVSTDESSGIVSRTVTEARGERHPHIVVQDKKGKILEDHYLPGKTQIEVDDGEEIQRGQVLARTPLSGAGNQDITSGLPRVTEIFEARKPKDPAVLAEIDGVVDIGEEKHRKVLVTVRNEKTGKEKVHEVPIGKHNLIVHTGDDIQAGQPLTDGQRVPNEILHISGEEAIQNYLIEEVQKVYRGQGVSINDKHIEVIISQMLRRVKVKDPGDTSLLEGDLVDKFIFRRHNQRLEKCVKVTEQGGTDFQVGEIVPKEVFDEKNAEAQAGGAEPAKAAPPAPAVAETQLLGIAKAAVQSESFISAASFQETTKVLSDAAVAYRIDNLVGLKENVILGRLIPAGTGFRKYQDAEWRYRPEAVENQPVPDLGQSVEMPLLSPDPTEEGAPEDLGVDFMPSFDDVQDEINPEEGDA